MNSSYGGSRFESRGPFGSWKSTQPYATLEDEDSSSYNKWISASVSIYNDAYYGGGRTICTNRGTGVLGFNSQGDRGGSHQGVGASR